MIEFNPTYPEDKAPAGIYIHIPFCTSRCNYCAFVTNPHDPDQEAAYFHRVVREMELWAEDPMFGEQIRNARFDSLYLGGGTPSVVATDLLLELVHACLRLFRFVEDPEITIELNPLTVARSDLLLLRSAGVNRASLGVQSLHDPELELMGRRHRAKDAYIAFEDLRSAGFDNVSVDLMAGFPGQTLDSVSRSLRGILEMDPEHLSIYLLEVKAGAELEHLVNAGKVPCPDDDLAADMYDRICSVTAAAGYEHYEISNFARDGHQCAHNLKYWQDSIFFGFGAGAHGMTGRGRCSNIENLRQYMESVDLGRLPFDSIVELTAETRFRDAMIMGLRLGKGLDLREIGERYGVEALPFVLETIGDLADLGLFSLNEERLTLTQRGRLLSNTIFSRWVT